MPFVDVIARKRDGQELSRDEIERFVVGATDGTVPDYQTSALLMAVVLRGMTDQETTWLTDAMVRSGSRVDLSDLPGVKVGKHSTGGVGDKVSIALAPLAAACGVLVPKMSGRGLGHTGGTLDKLESIPGFRVGLEIPEFKAVLREVGTCIIGQTTALAPADRKLYALRDVTATVESVPLIAASIMSKKLAEGSSALVLDVKCGRGAFMKDAAGARALASTMVAIGNRAGIATEAVITRMDSPLGAAVGNSVEIAECLRVLKGDGPSDLTALVMTLAARMVVLAGEPQEARAAVAVRRALESGAGLETLRRMIERQGGDTGPPCAPNEADGWGRSTPPWSAAQQPRLARDASVSTMRWITAPASWFALDRASRSARATRCSTFCTTTSDDSSAPVRWRAVPCRSWRKSRPSRRSSWSRFADR
jgi:pyrimidine-nucleoside phosphorylase/thymidine phosphorylase